MSHLMFGSLLKMSHLMVGSVGFFFFHQSRIKMSHLMFGSLLKMSHLMVGSFFFSPESYKDVSSYVRLPTKDVPSYGRIIYFFPAPESSKDVSSYIQLCIDVPFFFYQVIVTISVIVFFFCRSSP